MTTTKSRLTPEESKELMRDIKTREKNLWISILLSTDQALPLLSQHLTGSDLALLTGLPETAESLTDILLSIDPNKKILERIYRSLDPLPKEVTFIHGQWLQARNAFVTANLYLVHYFCPAWIKEKPFFEDAIQEGTIGLITTVNGFDLDRNVCFSTYAKYWIKQYIRRYLENHRDTVRRSVHLHEMRKKISRTRQCYYAQHGCDPLPEEVAEKTGLGLKKVGNVDSAFSWGVISTDQINDEGDKLGDSLPSHYPSVDELIDEKKVYESLDRSLDRLGERDRDILKSGLEGQTMKDISARYTVSRQRVQQIQQEAIKKLRFATKAA